MLQLWHPPVRWPWQLTHRHDTETTRVNDQELMRKDPVGFQISDREFHATLYQSCGNGPRAQGSYARGFYTTPKTAYSLACGARIARAQCDAQQPEEAEPSRTGATSGGT